MSGLRAKVVKLLRSPWSAPLSAPLARHYRGLSTSLMYHRVLPGAVDMGRTKTSHFHPNLILAVSEERFERQMRTIRDHHRPMSYAESMESLAGGALKRGGVTVTFDDGYRDNLTVALPILERYKIPATIFVTTGFIDRTVVPWWDELELILASTVRLRIDRPEAAFDIKLATDADRWSAFSEIASVLKRVSIGEREELMNRLREQHDASNSTRDQVARELLTWEEVKSLDRHPLITIAAHTVHHPALIHFPPEKVLEEMTGSRNRLEEMLGHPIVHFAYPFGGASEAGARDFILCGKAGFRSSVSTRAGHWLAGHRAHLHCLPRIMVEYFDDDAAFDFKLSGLDAFLQLRGRRFSTV